MKTFILISWRNLWRQKRRSLVVISSIGTGIFAMIFSMAFMNGMNVQMVDNTIRTSLGHAALHREGYFANPEIHKNFPLDADMENALKDNKLVKRWSPQLSSEAMIASSETSRPVVITGIDPKREKEVSRIAEYTSTEDGSRFLETSDEKGILISHSLAEKLDMLIGDTLVVMLQDVNNELQSTAFIVAGLYTSPVSSYDDYMVFTGLHTLQNITGVEGVTGITLIADNKENALPLAQSLQQIAGDKGLEALPWQERAPSLVRAVQLFDSMMFIFFAIVFVTVIFSVANTLIMAIMERFHEIGVMKSIGTRPAQIFLLVLLEALQLGLSGLIAGTAVGLLLVAFTGTVGIDLSFYSESMRSFGTGSVIFPRITPTDIAKSAVIVFFTTFIAALYPAMKAARIRALDALTFI